MIMKIHNKEISDIAKEIRAFCEKNKDVGVAKKNEGFFKEGYDAYGISREVFERQQNIFFINYKNQLGLEDFFDLADLLFASGKYEEASFAISFIKKLKKTFTVGAFERIGRWFEAGVRNWAHTDVICSELISYFIAENIILLKDFSLWRESSSKWKRRAVPVALLTMLKKTDDCGEMLYFIRPMMLDGERAVQQGLGWFLREAWKKQPRIVEAFLLEWKEVAPRLIFQYATEKMTREQKEKFRRSQKIKIGIKK